MPLVRALPYLHLSKKPVASVTSSTTSRKRSNLMAHRFLISQDSPVLYITIVTKDRLRAFQTQKMKEVLCLALDEARQSAGFLLFAYVIMLDHLHLLTSR